MLSTALRNWVLLNANRNVAVYVKCINVGVGGGELRLCGVYKIRKDAVSHHLLQA